MHREPCFTKSMNEVRDHILSAQSFLAVVLAGRTGPLNDLQREFLITTLGRLQNIELLVEVAFPSQPAIEHSSAADGSYSDVTPLSQHPEDNARLDLALQNY